MIYFVTARDLGRVKIGFSEKPAHRFVKIHTDSPVELRFERVCEGTVDDERDLHARFAAYRERGEWFALSDEIEAHMLTLDRPQAKREKSLNQIITEALGCSQSYASQVLSGKYGHKITIPIAVSVYRHCGLKIGPIELATEGEIDTLDKYCGRFQATRKAA